VAISVAGAGSKTLKTTPAAARSALASRIRIPPLAVAPSVQVPQGAGTSCPVTTTSSSVCSAKPCAVFVQSAQQPSVRRAKTPVTASCAGKARALPRAIPISEP
jgi:hypothetical protein